MKKIILLYVLFTLQSHASHNSSTVILPYEGAKNSQTTELFDAVINELNSSSLTSTSVFDLLKKTVDHCFVEKKNITETKDILRLFHNRLKKLEFINADYVVDFLHILPEKFAIYTTPPYAKNLTLYDKSVFDRFVSSVKTGLIKDFSTKFNDFKVDPELFIVNIAKLIGQMAQEEVELEQMRSVLVRFLEIACNKIIWSPYDKEKTWENVKALSKGLSTLVEANIITDIDDLDDLLWSVVHRYCYFLELTGSLLPSSFYLTVLHELETQPLLIKLIEEQDDLLKTKVSFLKEALEKGKEKAGVSRDLKVL